jgi:hypothetical protein
MLHCTLVQLTRLMWAKHAPRSAYDKAIRRPSLDNIVLEEALVLEIRPNSWQPGRYIAHASSLIEQLEHSEWARILAWLM